jgi:hypothetical protein
MEVANTLPYYDTAKITAVKSFNIEAPVCFNSISYGAMTFSQKDNPEYLKS